MSRTPVTVLTGYLGAGKTTLLNRILSEQHGRRYAVIVNEFGELGIDNDLVVGVDEEVFEMNNGCVCCTVRGDLIRIITGLMKRRAGFDGILIETTGLADPAPVAQTFFADPEVGERAQIDAVVTVVDAAYLEARLDDSREAAEQVAFADVILLNKIDLVDEANLARLERRIRGMNAYARILRSRHCDVPLDSVLGLAAFDLERILSVEPEFLDEHHHHHTHDDAVQSVSLRLSQPIDVRRFEPWIDRILQTQGADILRCKGILALSDDDRRYVFQSVHMMAQGTETQPWGDQDMRESRLVFIGRKLDAEALRKGFEACAA